MHKTTIFIIQLRIVVELFSLEDACGFIAETASFYVMHTVDTMVITRAVRLLEQLQLLVIVPSQSQLCD